MAGSKEKGMEKMEVEEEVGHTAEKVWQAYVHGLDTILPTIMPGHFDTYTVVQGPPLAVGSTFMVSYHPDMKHYDFIKFRWDEMDHREHRFKCTLIDGGALNKHFSHLAYTFTILPGPNHNSSLLHFTIEYEDMGDHTFHDFIQKEARTLCKSLGSHLDVKD